MNTRTIAPNPITKENLLARFNCGPVTLSGEPGALYDRHVMLDQVVAESETSARDKFEAIARSVRDVLSQRWLKTEQTYRQRNVKRVCYLSMEYLLGRTLANNLANLSVDPLWHEFCQDQQLDSLQVLEQEPDAGLGNGGLGRLAACFLDSMATLALPGMGYGLRYEYGIFRQHLRDGWHAEQPDDWLNRPDPWEVPRPNEAVEVRLNASFGMRVGALRVVEGRPSSLIGIPYDRPVVGYGGQTINTLRLWVAKTPDFFDFAQSSSGDFVGALAETLTRVLYPDDHTIEGKGLRFVQEYFLVACSLDPEHRLVRTLLQRPHHRRVRAGHLERHTMSDMNWLLQLPTTNPVAHAVAALSLVCCAGMMLGSLKVRGVGLGTAGVLFAGIIAGHFGKPVDHHTLAFVKEFGLILFVFTIGLQLGPGFFAAFRRQGMRLNLMAAAIVLAGTALALVLGRLLKLDFAAVLGVLAGATTNTPSLGGGPTDPRDDPRHRGRPPGVARARLRRDVSRRDSRHHRLAARGETLLPD